MKYHRKKFIQNTKNITAILGPTNTGKTHFALERMISYESGIFALPLRLLAREIYDKVSEKKGKESVALITGEEKIYPINPKYIICTIESMPFEEKVDFIAIDEIQLAADIKRGYTFTNGILNTRGNIETLFLGNQSIQNLLKKLIPEIKIINRPRFSKLSYINNIKISQLPKRSAIVAFSFDQVYALAQSLRHYKGGAAVVMGSLSPRTRNAQVRMFENGEVNYLVATDAIGMGLNLNIENIYFASESKFDGFKKRKLYTHEISQIAGRAGRYTKDGYFGTINNLEIFDEKLIEAIENHKFSNLENLQYRNFNINYSSVSSLIKSLNLLPEQSYLTKARANDDLLALQYISNEYNQINKIRDRDTIKLLWKVCSIPDFKKISPSSHAEMVYKFFNIILKNGHIPNEILNKNINELNIASGDIETLQSKLSAIRIWTFITHRSKWVVDNKHWQEIARNVENKLSDSLHIALTQKFVDKKIISVGHKINIKDDLFVDIKGNNDVYIEKFLAGKINGLRFFPNNSFRNINDSSIKKYINFSITQTLNNRVKEILNSSNEIEINNDNFITWKKEKIGRLCKGKDILNPEIIFLIDTVFKISLPDLLKKFLKKFVKRKINKTFNKLIILKNSKIFKSEAKGFIYCLYEGQGIVNKKSVDQLIYTLNKNTLEKIKNSGIVIGEIYIYMPELLKRKKLLLGINLLTIQSEYFYLDKKYIGREFFKINKNIIKNNISLFGYHIIDTYAIRVDIIENYFKLIKSQLTKGSIGINKLNHIPGIPKRICLKILIKSGIGYLKKSNKKMYFSKIKKTKRKHNIYNLNSPFAELKKLYIK